MKIKYTVILLLSFVLTLISAQDSRETEESNIPKKILRKYRIRRPVIIDENGNALTPRVGPRLRRIRVKQPQPKANDIAIEATPESLLDSRYGNIRQQARSQPQPQPETQALEQPQQPQQVYYNEQQVVEPVRVVPQYRKATSSSTRSALLANVNLRTTGDRDEDKKAVVGTTRNYSHINEDGSFTFGYEDGSFKEETRGTDCVVRGKYGYVDPDGIRREFSYVSGNPCDPNNPNPEENLSDEDDELASPPARAGIRQRVPIQRRPINQEEVQQGLEQTAEERVPDDQLPALFRVAPRQRLRQQPQPQRQDFLQPTTFRPRIRITQPPPTSPPVAEPQQLLARAFPQFRRPGPIVEDPIQTLDSPRTFNFDQELQQLQQIQQPEAQQQIQYQQQQPEPQQFQFQRQPQPQHQQFQHGFPQRQVFGGANAASLFNNYQPQPQQQQQRPPQPPTTAQPQPLQQQNYGNFRTELVYNPASGQYNSVVVQDIPQTNQEFTLTQRLRAFVNPSRPNEKTQFQFPTQQPQPQFQYFQQPQQQFAPQQQQQLERQPLYERSLYQPLPGSISRLHADAQEAMNSPASGQIDAFLRTLNIQA